MRVLLADDDPHVRSALRLLLEFVPGVSVVGDCTTAGGLIDQVELTKPNVVLLDWDLPGLRGSELVDRLRSAYPVCRLIALSCRPEQYAETLQAGIRSFVCKGDAPESLLAALLRRPRRAGK